MWPLIPRIVSVPLWGMKKVDEIHIKAAEEKLGALFPDEYKELLS